VQEHHRGAVEAEQDAVDVAAEAGADLEEPTAEGVDEGLPEGPSPLNLLNVRPDILANLRG